MNSIEKRITLRRRPLRDGSIHLLCVLEFLSKSKETLGMELKINFSAIREASRDTKVDQCSEEIIDRPETQAT